jgi:hypothetical protein
MTKIIETHTGAIRYDDVREGPLVLTAEEAEIYEKKASALRKLLSNKDVVAKYKIEILLGKSRSSAVPIPGAMSFWKSGARFHGGGDDKLYLCPGLSLDRSRCHSIIQDACNTSKGVICPACGTVWRHEDVIGEVFLKLSIRKWSEAVYRYFRLLEYNCDIYLKFAPDDIRNVALSQVDKQTFRGECKLENVRTKRSKAIYPLKNILYDTNAGADLLGRFHAFLTA